jgi:hypothetical protein
MTERVFKFPVCCGGNIHIVSLYDNLSIVQTTHNSDPDAWLQETISDLTGDHPPCEEFSNIVKYTLDDYHVTSMEDYSQFHEWSFMRYLVAAHLHNSISFLPVQHYDFLGILSKVTREAVHELNIHLDSDYVRLAIKLLDTIDSTLDFYEKLEILPDNAVSTHELDMVVFSSLRGAEERLSKWAGKVSPSTYITTQANSRQYFIAWIYNRLGHALGYLKRYIELTLGRQEELSAKRKILNEFIRSISDVMSQHGCLTMHYYRYPLSKEDKFVVEAEGDIYGRKWVLENVIKQNNLFLTRTPPELFLARCDRNRP